MNDRMSKPAFDAASGKTQADQEQRDKKRTEREKAFFQEKVAEFRGKLNSEQGLNRLDLQRSHDRETTKLKDRLDQTYGEQRSKDQKALNALKAKRKKQQLSEQERQRVTELQKNLANIRMREKEQLGKLKTKQAEKIKEFDKRSQEQNNRAERAIHSEWQKRQLNGWKPSPVVFNTAAQANETKKPSQKPQVKSSSAPTPTLAPRGAKTGNLRPANESSRGSARSSQGQRASVQGTGRGSDVGL